MSPYYDKFGHLGSGPWCSKRSLATVAKIQLFATEGGLLGNVSDASNIAESMQEERDQIVIL